MSRNPSTAKSYKITLHGGMEPYIQHLASLGLYGLTPTEVLRRLVEMQIQQMVSDGTFQKAADTQVLVSGKKGTSSNNK